MHVARWMKNAFNICEKCVVAFYNMILKQQVFVMAYIKIYIQYYVWT